MSGGSWDYFSYKLEDVASRLQSDIDPMRKAFGTHLQKCAEALHAIEWVDSSDWSKCDELHPIKTALGKDGGALVLQEVRKQAEEALKQLQTALANFPDG